MRPCGLCDSRKTGDENHVSRKDAKVRKDAKEGPDCRPLIQRFYVASLNRQRECRPENRLAFHFGNQKLVESPLLNRYRKLCTVNIAHAEILAFWSVLDELRDTVANLNDVTESTKSLIGVCWKP